jgi:hypothetical protein
LAKRTFSTDGTISIISSATEASSSVASAATPPISMPRRAARSTRSSP